VAEGCATGSEPACVPDREARLPGSRPGREAQQQTHLLRQLCMRAGCDARGSVEDPGMLAR